MDERDSAEKELKRLILLALLAWYSSVFHAVRFHRGVIDIDWKKEKEEFIDSLKTALLAVATTLGNADAKYWKEQGKPFDSDANEIFAVFLISAGNRLQRIADVTERATRIEIQRHLDSGSSLDTLAQRLQQWYGEKRAQRISEMESGFMIASETAYAMRQLGAHRWEWMHYGSDTPCAAFCAFNVGRIFTLNDPMPPHNTHVRCHCRPKILID